ncbi:hypothetical protein FKM82_006407 [Ascaphus truei]
MSTTRSAWILLPRQALDSGCTTNPLCFSIEVFMRTTRPDGRPELLKRGGVRATNTLLGGNFGSQIALLSAVFQCLFSSAHVTLSLALEAALTHS